MFKSGQHGSSRNYHVQTINIIYNIFKIIKILFLKLTHYNSILIILRLRKLYLIFDEGFQPRLPITGKATRIRIRISYPFRCLHLHFPFELLQHVNHLVQHLRVLFSHISILAGILDGVKKTVPVKTLILLVRVEIRNALWTRLTVDFGPRTGNVKYISRCRRVHANVSGQTVDFRQMQTDGTSHYAGHIIFWSYVTRIPAILEVDNQVTRAVTC